MKLFIDLFAGLCGASQAFIDDQGWKVLAIDNNQLCIDEVESIRGGGSLRGTPGLTYFKMDLSDSRATIAFLKRFITRGVYESVVIWASPPCTEFSDAQINRPSNPSLALMLSTMEIIEAIGPDSWFLENVKGAIRDFKPYVGVHRQKMGSFFVWGNFPYVGVPRIDLKKDDAWSTNPLRANIRAKVPFEISLAILKSLELQSRLDEWL